eukprot:2126603-Pyramimonas_sp.AAC.1
MFEDRMLKAAKLAARSFVSPLVAQPFRGPDLHDKREATDARRWRHRLTRWCRIGLNGAQHGRKSESQPWAPYRSQRPSP